MPTLSADTPVWVAAMRRGITYHRPLDPRDNGTILIGCGRIVEWVSDGQIMERGWTVPLGDLKQPIACPRCDWPQ